MSCSRTEPTVLRIPTSFALFSERAVLRFIKLIQASNNTNTPITANIHTYSIWPPACLPSFHEERKCQSFIGCRKIAALNLFSSSSTLFSLAFSMLRFTEAKSVLSFICAKAWKELLPHCVAACVSQPSEVLYKSQGAINFSSLNVVL